ncbi:MAG: hypothetical protein AAGJ70_04500 [Pseudomonadota bacterium]
MHIVLLLAFILLTGGYLGATAFQAGTDVASLSAAQLLAIGESASVIIALILPAALLLVVMLARDAARLMR